MGLSDTMRNIPRFEPLDSEMAEAKEVFFHSPTIAGLARAGEALSSKPLLPGNEVTCLSNGDEAFPAMIEAIEEAKHSVGLLSYIFDSDRAGQQFVDALVQAKDRGVEVRVLIDGVGARYSKESMITRLKRFGVNTAGFLPPNGFFFPPFFQSSKPQEDTCC